jgi:hypothetical protein
MNLPDTAREAADALRSHASTPVSLIDGDEPEAVAGLVGDSSAPGATLTLPRPRKVAPRVSTEEFILPSGRAVRLRAITTEEYVGARERAANATGDVTKKPDPNGARYQALLDVHMLSLMVQAYTDPMDWSETRAAQKVAQAAAFEREHRDTPLDERPRFEFTPDPDAMLEALDPEDWRTATPMSLMIPTASTYIRKVFNEPADWDMLAAVAAVVMTPRRDLAGIAGKARKAR